MTMHDELKPRGRRCAAHARAGVALAVLTAVLAAPLQGQVVPPPVVQTLPSTPMAAPVAPVVPTLTSSQMEQLTRFLTDGAAAQGLRQSTAWTATPTNTADMVRAVLDQAHAIHAGRLDTADFQQDWGLRPDAYDPAPAFAEAVRTNRVNQWIASLAPPYAGYDGLAEGLATYRKLAAGGGWATLAAGPDLGMGASGARVTALRTRLAFEDPDVARSGATFDAGLRDAVRRAQNRYGLNPTGIASTQTLAALNVSAGARVRQIMANMERWRWLPAELPKDRIQVNIAAAVLTVFDGDTPVASMRAVTGRPGNETPMLRSTIHSVVINPPWNVPTSIATKELWPKEKRNPGYLRRAGYKIIPTGNGGSRLQQEAGNRSALGRYKFDFDNPYAVYLHDTPSQATFASFSRLASHGCVRLEKPGELADLLLKGDPAWTPEIIDATVEKGETTRARLTKPVAVYLLYWTAFASANGRMNFRADPYGWDSTLASKIEARSTRQTVAAL